MKQDMLNVASVETMIVLGKDIKAIENMTCAVLIVIGDSSLEGD